MTAPAVLSTALVVDDDPFLRDVTAELLRQLGVTETWLAADGTEALAVVARVPSLDLVLCDLDMPGMDGIEFLRHLADSAFDGSVAVMSGTDPDVLATAGDLARLHGLRLIGVLPKPVDAERLRAALDAAPPPVPATPTPAREAPTAPALTADDVRSGLAQGRADIHVQPKVTVIDRRVVGAEALLRWRAADGSLLPPSAVLPVAEEHGLAHGLTLAVFRRAVTALAAWRREGLDLRVSVNLARANLTSLSLPDEMAAIAADAGVDAGGITLEVSQTGVLDDLSTGMEIVGRLRLKGFGIAIDDYGMGYSSLGQLKNLPVTELKVARTFVEGAEADRALSEILGSSATLGRSLGLSVVAQGVESVDVLALLESLGCDEMQGYLVARPMAPEDFPDWVRRWNATWHREAGAGRGH